MNLPGGDLRDERFPDPSQAEQRDPSITSFQPQSPALLDTGQGDSDSGEGKRKVEGAALVSDGDLQTSVRSFNNKQTVEHGDSVEPMDTTQAPVGISGSDVVSQTSPDPPEEDLHEIVIMSGGFPCVVKDNQLRLVRRDIDGSLLKDSEGKIVTAPLPKINSLFIAPVNMK